jgi:hypothetical protein
MTLSIAVAAIALLGASVLAEAHSTLSRVPGIRDLTEDRKIALDSWLHDLYPAGPGQYWGSLQPDRIAEYHVVLQDARSPGLLTDLLTGATEDQAIRALTLLDRARVHQPQIRERLRELVTQLKSVLEPVAVTLALLARDPSLNIKLGAGTIYATVSIEERPAILAQWLSSSGGST